MTRQQIIENLDFKRVRKIINTVTKGSPSKQDVEQDIYVILLTMDEDKFWEMYNKRKDNIYYYITGVCKFQNWSKQHNKKYKNFNLEFNPQIFDIELIEYDLEEDIEKKDIEDNLYRLINEEKWFDKTLFKMYIEDESVIRISNKTKIPRKRIKNSLEQTKENIKNKLK